MLNCFRTTLAILDEKVREKVSRDCGQFCKRFNFKKKNQSSIRFNKTFLSSFL